MLARLTRLRVVHRRPQRFLTPLIRTTMSTNTTQDNAKEADNGETSLTKSAGTIRVDRFVSMNYQT